MVSKTTSTPLSTSCSYRNIVNVEPISTVPRELEDLSEILSKSEKLTSEIDNLLSASIPTKDKHDHHRVILTGFWIITSIMSHAIYKSITDLHKCIKALEPTIQSKLEIDVVALNIISHDVYDLSRLYIALLRVLQTKSDKAQLNQHSRLFDLIIAKGECLQQYSCSYLDRFTTALGREADEHELTLGVHQTLKSVSYFTRIITQLKSMILTSPVRKFEAFTHTQTGRSMLSWLGTTLRLVVRNLAPPMLSLAFEEIATSLHPIDMLSRAKSDAVQKRPISSSELTLRRSAMRDDIPKI